MARRTCGLRGAISLTFACLFAAASASAADAQRAREVGVPFEGKPGSLNAITDVAGVEVGQVTLISGEMTGTTWLEERGYFDGPIMITNTHSVGVVRDAVVGWIVDHKWPGSWYTPVVAETYDGYRGDSRALRRDGQSLCVHGDVLARRSDHRAAGADRRARDTPSALGTDRRRTPRPRNAGEPGPDVTDLHRRLNTLRYVR